MDRNTSFLHVVVTIALDWRCVTALAVVIRLLRKR